MPQALEDMININLNKNERLKKIANVGMTWNRHLTARWPDVEPSYLFHVDHTSKVALVRCGLPTLGPRSECATSTLCPRGPKVSLLSGQWCGCDIS